MTRLRKFLSAQTVLFVILTYLLFPGAQAARAAAPVSYFNVTPSTTSISLGVPFSITVVAKDVFNNTVTSYNGTVRFVSNDPQATLPANYTFTGADAGTHTFTGIILRTQGQVTVSVWDVYATTVGGSTGSIAVGPAVPTAAATFTVTPSTTSTISGGAISVTVTARDGSNNVLTGYTGTVHFSSTDPAATLPADYTFTAGDAGIHTFVGVILRTQGTMTITASDLFSPAVTGSSAGISVTGGNTGVGIATAFTVLPSLTSTPAGSAIGVTVIARDVYGNTTTGYTGTVRLTSTDPAASLPAAYTFTAADSGQHFFLVTLNTAGGQTVTASDLFSPAITGTSAVITVGGGTGITASLSLSPAGPQTVPAGQTLTFRYTAYDAYNHVVTGGTPTWTVNGVGSAPGGNFSSTQTGQATVSVSVDGRTAVSGPITVVAGPPRTISVSASAATVAAGGNARFTATVLDAYGNQVTGVPIVWSTSAGAIDANGNFIASGNPGTVTVTATVYNNGVPLSGNASITVTGGNTGAGIATAFTVLPGSTSTPAGTVIGVTVIARDLYGNTATNYTGTVRLTSTDPAASLPGNYTFTAADRGQHFFPITLNTAGGQTVTASDLFSPAITGTSAVITVSGGTVAGGVPRTIRVTGSAATVVVGGNARFTATVLDANGNQVTGVPVIWSTSAGAVDASGNFFAGSNPGTATVTATVYNNGVPLSGNASITIIASGSSSSGGTGGGTGGSSGSGSDSSGGTGRGPGTYADGCTMGPSSRPIPLDGQTVTSQVFLNCPAGLVLVTFVFPAGTNADAALLAYYWDTRWSKWVAVPTTVNLDNTATAWLHAQTSVVLMRTGHVRQPNDLSGDWATPHVLKLESLGIMDGYSDGGFHPGELMSRYAVARALALALDLNINNPDLTLLNQQADRNTIPTALRAYVAAVLNAGVMVGYGDGFYGDIVLNRAQMATLVGRLIKTGAQGPIDFIDAATIPDWARPGVSRAVAYHILDGFEDHSFRPNDMLTRSQFAKILSQVLDTLYPPPWSQ